MNWMKNFTFKKFEPLITDRLRCEYFIDNLYHTGKDARIKRFRFVRRRNEY
jgi:hypothetical protein